MTPEDEQRALGKVMERLQQRYPALARDVIGGLVDGRTREFDGRPIRDFVPLLVERGVVKEIESVTASAQVAS